MAEKQSISRHKTTSTRAAAASGQSFDDVIPAGKVKPSASSRPVITQTTPSVADNTLKSDEPAPDLKLTHATPKLDAPKATAKSADPKTPDEQGVLLADLVAKRDKVASSTESDDSDDNDDKAAEKDAATDPDKPTAESDGTSGEDDAVPADDSVDSVMNAADETDDSGEPKEQSAEVKAAIKDLDEGDGRPHHELYGGKPVIVVHNRSGMSALAWFLWFILCLGLALLAVDLLLDAGMITTNYVIPHTHFFK